MMEKLTQDMADKAWAIIEGDRSHGRHDQGRRIRLGQDEVESAPPTSRRASTPARTSSSASTSTSWPRKTRSTSSTSTTTPCAIRRSPPQEDPRQPRQRRRQAALDALTKCAETGEGNLLDLAVKAMRLRATVGEVSDALEKIFGRFRANNQTISAFTEASWKDRKAGKRSRRCREVRTPNEGRRPRIMIAKLGQDGHDRGAKVVATAFADLGFDIDVGPLFQTPEEAARLAIENDVHAIGCSSLAAGHKTLVPALIKALKDQGADDIIVFAGGVIPAQDYDTCSSRRRQGIFGPGTRSRIRPQGAGRDPQGSRPPPSKWRRHRMTPVAGELFLLALSVLSRNRKEGCRPQGALVRTPTCDWPWSTARRQSGAGQDHHPDRIDPRRSSAARAEGAGALLPHTGKAIRVGISGVPGAGKSTFIEALGLYLIERGHKLAVLAVDPSSSVPAAPSSATRRAWSCCASATEAFIRPSPSAGSLGGVAEKTREAMLVCEAAGFDVIIVETVGVGQSETTVAGMVDIFVPAAVAERRRRPAGDQEGHRRDRRPGRHQQGRHRSARRRVPRADAQALHMLRPASRQLAPPVLTSVR
jgi:methylmalonyl-CoA mutase cobalamin-binding domain/chain